MNAQAQDVVSQVILGQRRMATVPTVEDMQRAEHAAAAPAERKRRGISRKNRELLEVAEARGFAAGMAAGEKGWPLLLGLASFVAAIAGGALGAWLF